MPRSDAFNPSYYQFKSRSDISALKIFSLPLKIKISHYYYIGGDKDRWEKVNLTIKRCTDRSYDRTDDYFISNKSMTLTFDQNSPRRESVLES